MNNEIPSQTNTKILTINLWAALSVLGASIIGALVLGTFAGFATVNSDHFLLQSTVQAFTDSKNIYVRSDVYQANQVALNDSLISIDKHLDSIDKKLTK